MKTKKFLLLIFVLATVLFVAACNDEGHTHSFTEVAAKSATCTEDGNVAYKYCADCGKYFDLEGGELQTVVVKASHNLIKVEGQEATCTEDGKVTYNHCSACEKDFDLSGNELTTVVITAGHKLTDVPAKEATCGEEGNVAHKHCSSCGKNYDENDVELEKVTIDALEHTLESVDAVTPSCTENGVVAHQHCSACLKNFDEEGNELTTVVDPAHHTLETVTANAPTCTEDGVVAHQHCTVCLKDFNEDGTELTTTVDPAHHTLESVPAEAPTCTEDGVVAHQHCTVCLKNFNEEGTELTTIVDPAQHTLEAVEGTPSTCTVAGTLDHLHCTVCLKDFDEEMNELSSLEAPLAAHDETVLNYLTGKKDCSCGAAGTTDLPKSSWYLMGTLTDWGTGKVIYQTENADVIRIDMQVSANATIDFKIKNGGTWLGNGGTATNNMLGWELKEAGNFVLKTTEAGVYTFYFNTKAKIATVLNPSYDASTLSMGVCGDFTGWGNQADIALTKQDGLCWSGTTELTAGQTINYKVRLNSNWDVSYGANFTGGDASFTATDAGTYRFTVDFINGIYKWELVTE